MICRQTRSLSRISSADPNAICTFESSVMVVLSADVAETVFTWSFNSVVSPVTISSALMMLSSEHCEPTSGFTPYATSLMLKTFALSS